MHCKQEEYCLENGYSCEDCNNWEAAPDFGDSLNKKGEFVLSSSFGKEKKKKSVARFWIRFANKFLGKTK